MKQAGEMIVMSPDADRPLLEQATAQCVHCSGHFPIQPGSGKDRGYCRNCAGPICGPGCVNCVPFEVLLENIEQGRPLDYRPIVVPSSF